MAKQIKNITKIYTEALTLSVDILDADRVHVSSGENVYIVNTNSCRCTCPRDEFIDDENGMVNACKHVMAALIAKWKLMGFDAVPFPADSEEATKLFVDDSLKGDGVVLVLRAM